MKRKKEGRGGEEEGRERRVIQLKGS